MREGDGLGWVMTETSALETLADGRIDGVGLVWIW